MRRKSKDSLAPVTAVAYSFITRVTDPVMKSIRITNAEWEVMLVVWGKAPVAAAAIAAELESAQGWTLTTVRTLLRRLVEKGALSQQLEGKRYLYVPLVSMESCIRRESDTFWDRVLGRAPGATLVNLVRRADLSPSDIEELRKILKEKEK